MNDLQPEVEKLRKEVRKAKSKSQVARDAGITRHALRAFLDGSMITRPQTLSKIAKALNMRLEIQVRLKRSA